jgi:hypothetical protein
VHHSKSGSPMTEMGQNPNLPHRNTDARFTSISRPQQGGFTVVSSRINAASLLDHFVGEREQERRHGEAERLGGPHIDEQFDLCGLLHR